MKVKLSGVDPPINSLTRFDSTILVYLVKAERLPHKLQSFA
jgi:hypothetical protein